LTIKSFNRVTGRLVHAREKTLLPIHHLKVALYDHDLLLDDDFLGEAFSDGDGRFQIEYDPRAAGPLDTPDLEVRVLDYPWDLREREQGRGGFRLLGRFRPPGKFSRDCDFGTLRIEFWEYADGSLARLYYPPDIRPFKIPKELAILESGLQDLLCLDQEKKPQRYVYGYVQEFARVGARYFTARSLLEAKNRIAADCPDIDEIQSAFPENLTLQVDAREPGTSRGDVWLGDRVLNGFNPCLPLRDPDRADCYRVRYDWEPYEQDGVHDLPSVDLTLERVGQKLLPVKIAVRAYRASETVTCTPADAERWLQAKRIFRTSYLTAGEADAHLSRGHVNMEQYAIAAFRNLMRNPVRDLLFPHLKELVLTNDRGATLIFGVEGILATNSGLTPAAVEQRILEQVSRQDWCDWRPRTPLCDGHRFALAANLFWDLLSRYVDEFLRRNDAQIRRYWYEIRRFSQDLVAHATPFQADNLREQYYDDREIAAADRPRVAIEGKVRSVSPLTTAGEADAPGLANLAQVCRYIIYHTTFWHSWCHNRQSPDGGDLRYATLGLRHGSWGAESDPTIAPTPADMIVQLFIANVLDRVRYGYLTKNEDGDAGARLITALDSARQKFAAGGLRVDEARSLSII